MNDDDDGLLCVYVCATKGFTYATEAQARSVLKALASEISTKDRVKEVRFILVGLPNAGELLKLLKFQRHMTVELDVEILPFEADPSAERYKNEFQLYIAQMRQMAFDRAAQLGAKWLWGLDADVLPKPNSLRCMLDMIEFDDGYYDVAFCPYPSQGGGSFMGGRGTPQETISPDFYEGECEVSAAMLKKRDALQKKLGGKAVAGPARKKAIEEVKEIQKKIRSAKPKFKNVFAANAVEWRKRGWLDVAYPAIGKGAVVPLDWCGSGCTLMSRKAYLLGDWGGYDGEGTEDLFLIWRRWHPNGVKIAGLPHCPSDHIIRAPGKGEGKGKLIHLMTGHEEDGEFEGHLRQVRRPFYQQVAGEQYDSRNDANQNTPQPTSHPDKLEK